MSVDISSPPPSPPSQIIVQQPPTMFGRYGKWLVGALVLAIMAVISIYGKYSSYFSPADGPVEKYHSLSKTAMKKIAIIDVDGAIYTGEDGFIKKQIDRVKDDSDVVAIVMRINSPGGTVTASDYLYHHLRELTTERNLPIVVSMGGICASGGYYLAMAVGNEENSIFAEPTTWTGSIGVIIPHYDFTGVTTAWIRDDSIVSGPYKQIGSPTKRMTSKEREILQSLVDDSFKGFKNIVMDGRPKFKADPAALDAVATGQIFTASQAVDKGLVDKVGFIEDAIARAAEMANVSTSDVRCVKYERTPTFMGELLGADTQVPARGSIDIAALMDLATPRAYYLWSWLPAAMTNSR